MLEAGGALLPLDAARDAAALEAEALAAHAVALLVGDAAEDQLVVVPVDASRREVPAEVCLLVEAEGGRVALTRAALAAAVDAARSARGLDARSQLAPSGPLHRREVLVGEVLATLRAGGTLRYVAG